MWSMEVPNCYLVARSKFDALLASSRTKLFVIPFEVIPFEVIPIEVIPFEVIPFTVIPFEVIPFKVIPFEVISTLENKVLTQFLCKALLDSFGEIN